VKIVALLLNMERVFELLKKQPQNQRNEQYRNKQSQVTKSLSALIFVYFEPLDFFFFLGSVALLLSEKSYLPLDAPNWELSVTNSCFGKMSKSDSSHARH